MGLGQWIKQMVSEEIFVSSLATSAVDGVWEFLVIKKTISVTWKFEFLLSSTLRNVKK